MSTTTARTVTLRSGTTVSVLGLGTWRLGEDPKRRRDEIDALRLGVDLGMTVIDTAEMYGDGATEKLVGEALGDRRGEIFLVSKALPSHARGAALVAACDRSLKRLRTDYLDLYLLHWRESTPLEETVETFELLKQAGKILHWGVSNFDVDDIDELVEISGGKDVAANQVLYNLSRRGIEFDLLPRCRERQIAVMAYSPIEQGELLAHPMVRRVATRHDATPAQVALAWVLRQEGVIAIPKAGNPAHVREDWEALEIRLTKKDLEELDKAFPPPKKKVSLETS
jgi:diketogulonate reductase-like aldo/keto reductase